jgi:hypothetical protein
MSPSPQKGVFHGRSAIGPLTISVAHRRKQGRRRKITARQVLQQQGSLRDRADQQPVIDPARIVVGKMVRA